MPSPPTPVLKVNCLIPDVCGQIALDGGLSIQQALDARLIDKLWKEGVDGELKCLWEQVRHILPRSMLSCVNAGVREEESICSFKKLYQLFKKAYGIQIDLHQALAELPTQIRGLVKQVQAMERASLERCAVFHF
jgi:hypothetical protein